MLTRMHLPLCPPILLTLGLHDLPLLISSAGYGTKYRYGTSLTATSASDSSSIRELGPFFSPRWTLDLPMHSKPTWPGKAIHQTHAL